MHTEVEHIAQLTAFLEKDLVSPHPRYPQQALYAVRDERVALAIAERLHNNETLINIVPLDYSFYTGLIPIYFEFAKAGGIGLGPTSLLVILDCDIHPLRKRRGFPTSRLSFPASLEGALASPRAKPSYPSSTGVTFPEPQGSFSVCRFGNVVLVSS